MIIETTAHIAVTVFTRYVYVLNHLFLNHVQCVDFACTNSAGKVSSSAFDVFWLMMVVFRFDLKKKTCLRQ